MQASANLLSTSEISISSVTRIFVDRVFLLGTLAGLMLFIITVFMPP